MRHTYTMLIVCFVCANCQTSAGQDNFIHSVLDSDRLTKYSNWVEIGKSEAIDAMDLIADQTKGNYEKIRTWKVEYAVHKQSFHSSAEVVEMFPKKQFRDKGNGLKRDSRHTQVFVTDMNSGAVYRSCEDSEFTFKDTLTKQPVQIPDVSPVRDRTITTSEHHLEFSPQTRWSGFTQLSGHPDAKSKRTVFRFAPDRSERRHFAHLMDPRMFFAMEQNGAKSWDILKSLVESWNGDKGEQRKIHMDKYFRVFRCGDQSSIEAFRISGRLGISYWSGIFDADEGFNLSNSMSSMDPSGEVMQQLKEIEWAVSDGVFIPSRVLESQWDLNDGNLRLKRESIIQECAVNSPLSEQQFTYEGLGMKDGDIIKDNIDEVFSIMRNGRVVKLADFGEEYVHAPKKSNRVWFVLLNVLLVAVLVIAVYRRRT